VRKETKKIVTPSNYWRKRMLLPPLMVGLIPRNLYAKMLTSEEQATVLARFGISPLSSVNRFVQEEAGC